MLSLLCVASRLWTFTTIHVLVVNLCLFNVDGPKRKGCSRVRLCQCALSSTPVSPVRRPCNPTIVLVVYATDTFSSCALSCVNGICTWALLRAQIKRMCAENAAAQIEVTDGKVLDLAALHSLPQEEMYAQFEEIAACLFKHRWPATLAYEGLRLLQLPAFSR